MPGTSVEATKGYGFAFAQFMRGEGWRKQYFLFGWVNYRQCFDLLNGVRS